MWNKSCLLIAFGFCIVSFTSSPVWTSRFVEQSTNGRLIYHPDEEGNTIPDFSNIGYAGGNEPIPDVPVIKTIKPGKTGNDQDIIQAAIDEVSKRPIDKKGFRGAILLKKGVYKIPGTIYVRSSGIVIKGIGDFRNGTELVATGNEKRPLIHFLGEGKIEEIASSKTEIIDTLVPAGARSFRVASADQLKAGDKVILFRPGTSQWVSDLKMDRIEERPGTKQWTPAEYNLRFERIITKVEGNRITLDNPVMMPMQKKYGGGSVYKYKFEGRISKVGIEFIRLRSEYRSDTAEDHSWDAIQFEKAEHGWVRNITALHFAFSCVNLRGDAKNITVINASCYEPKSVITGGRRYSFNNDGQLNLFYNCRATEGRHDFVTGARALGPNAFVDCSAKNTHADIGPHHRWAVGTLYDNVITDGDINIQDRGNWGSGHGWAGVTQVLWNCTAKRAAVQSPWVNGKNYAIGLKGEKYEGRLSGRPDGVWEGHNKEGLEPGSLFFAQSRAAAKRNYRVR